MNGSPSPLSYDLLLPIDQKMARLAAQGDLAAAAHIAALTGDKALVAQFLLRALLKNCDRIGSNSPLRLDQEIN